MTYNISSETKDQIIEAIESGLDTRDKRYMFMKIHFKDVLAYLNLEGTAHHCAWSIYIEFEKRNMLGQLVDCLNSTFDLSLIHI